MRPAGIINCHCHVFSVDCVPGAFRERFAIDLRLRRNRLLHRFLNALLQNRTRLTEWLDFVSLSIAEITDRLVAEMDEAGIELAVPLMMDMAYTERFGGDIKPYEEQIAETLAAVAAVHRRYGRTRLLPFVAVDPRRPGGVDLSLDQLQRGRCAGVKIYPVMGFLPADERLWPLYRFCEAFRVPITTHCENGGLPGFQDDYHFAAPQNWEPVLAAFPTLVLNLAHNDHTGSAWQREIHRLMRVRPHVYTDISYDTEMWYMPGAYFRSVRRLLRTPGLRDRVLFGTDWYMGRYLWTEASYVRWFTHGARRIFWRPTAFSREELERLMVRNPRRFLGLAPGDMRKRGVS